MCEEDQTKNQRMTLDEFRRQVVQCLIKNEGLTEAEARNWMTGEDEDLRRYLQQGLDPLTAAQIIVA